MNLAMVVVAAGRGARFGADKLAEMLAEKTVLETALESLRRAMPDAPTVVVVPPERVGRWRRQLGSSFPNAVVVGGGQRRQDSVRIGVRTAAEAKADVVAIHDAARPLVDPEDVKGVVWALGDGPGAVLTAQAVDTVKRVDAEGVIVETIARRDLRLAQTPQVFTVSALEEAWAQTGDDVEWTDESALLEANGHRVRSVVARHPNPKLTKDSDLRFLRALQGTPR